MALERIGLGALLEFATGDAVREMERADAAREKLGQGFERLGAGVDRISGGLRQTLGAVAQVGAAAAAAGAGAVQRFATFETSLAKIGTLLDDGAAGAQKYGPAIERMSVQFGQSAAVVSEGVFQAISASVKAEEAIGFMEEAQKGATAGMTDAVVAVDALTTAINAYGDKLFVQGTAAQKAKALNDAIFVANKLGKTTYDEIAKSIGLVASTAAGANVDFRELTSAIAAMTSAGIQTNQSVTAINQAILAFTNPTQEAKKKAAELGIEFNANTLRTMGFAKALEYVKTATGGNEEALGALFGSVEAGRAVAVLAGTGMQNFKTALETTKTTVGITDRAFADMSNTLTFRFKQATQAADTGARRIGRAIVEELGLGSANAVPIIEQAFERMEGAVRRFIQLARQGFEQLRIRERLEAIGGAVQALKARMDAAFGSGAGEQVLSIATALGVMAAAAVPVLAVLSPIVSAFTGLVSIAGGAVSALGGVGSIAAGAGNAIAFLGANLLSITGIGALVAATLQAFIDNASGVRDAFIAMFEQIWGFVTTVGQVLMDLFAALQPTLQAVGEVIGAVLAPAFELIGMIFEKLSPLLQSVGELFVAIFEVVGALASAISAVLVPVLEVLWSIFKPLAEFLMDTVVAAFDAVIGAVKTLVGWIKDAIDWVAELFSDTEEVSDAVNKTVSTAAGGRGIATVMSEARTTVVQESIARASAAKSEQASAAVASAPAAQVNATASAVAKEACKNKIEIANTMKVDGRSMNVATSRAQLELTERAGSNVTPWQRRQIIERGAVAVGA